MAEGRGDEEAIGEDEGVCVHIKSVYGLFTDSKKKKRKKKVSHWCNQCTTAGSCRPGHVSS